MAQCDRRDDLYIKLLGADGGGEGKHRLGQTLTVDEPGAAYSSSRSR